eukprot:SAG22_NODE_19016_length_279_cov_0.566667_1_plen_44_part_01
MVEVTAEDRFAFVIQLGSKDERKGFKARGRRNSLSKLRSKYVLA